MFKVDGIFLLSFKGLVLRSTGLKFLCGSDPNMVIAEASF